MTTMDKVVLTLAGGMDQLFVIGYLIQGQPMKALYWLGATLIAIATAQMGGH